MLPIKVALHQVLGEAYAGLVVGFDGIGATGDKVEEGGAQMLFERRKHRRLASVRYLSRRWISSSGPRCR